MPKVQSYGPQRVKTGAIPGAQKQAHETFESQGGLEAEARGQVARAQGQAAAVGLQLGAGIMSETFRREREKADQVALLDRDQQLGQLEIELLHSEKGALNVKGKNALGLRESVIADYDKRSGEIGTGLTDRQRLAYERARSQRRLSISEAVERHSVSEMNDYDKQVTAASVDQDVSLAITNAGIKEQVTQKLADGEEKIRQHGARQGFPKELTDNLVAKFRNDLWSGVIKNRIATGNDNTARLYFEEARDAGLLTGEPLSSMADAVKASTVDGQAERSAQAIWDRLAPKDGDGKAIELDKMEAAARSEWTSAGGGDTKVLDATIARLRSRKNGVDDARQARDNERSSSIWGAIYEGKDLDQVRRLDAFIDAPGEVKNKVSDYFDAVAAREESRAASRESRAASAESRALNADLRKERRLELDGWSKYFELSQPESLRKMAPGQILEQLPVLGNAHVQRLLAEKEQLVKRDSSLASANIDADVFREVADGAGLSYAYTAPGGLSKVQKANLGQLRVAVNEAIAKEQGKVGRPLSDPEARKVATDVADSKVLVARSYWFDESQVAAIVNEKDRARAYVPIAEVPTSVVGDYSNWLRSEMPALGNLSNDDVKARYSQRLERAYALRLLGAKRADIESVLRGK